MCWYVLFTTWHLQSLQPRCPPLYNSWLLTQCILSPSTPSLEFQIAKSQLINWSLSHFLCKGKQQVFILHPVLVIRASPRLTCTNRNTGVVISADSSNSQGLSLLLVAASEICVLQDANLCFFSYSSPNLQTAFLNAICIPMQLAFSCAVCTYGDYMCTHTLSVS